MNELMSDEAVCRTATATPGLLIREGALELIILSSVFFVPFVHVCDPSLRTCSHGRRVQGEE